MSLDDSAVFKRAAVGGPSNCLLLPAPSRRCRGMLIENYNAIPTTVQMQVIVSFSNFAVTEPSVTASQRAAHS
jgi:hypothetical protein